MSTTPTNKVLRDPRDAVRNALANVEERLPTREASPALREAWTALVNVLALGPAPALRECPSCGSVIMRDALRCGHCWVRLSPVDGP